MKRFTVLLTILAMFGLVTACDDDPKKEKTEICDNGIDDDGDTLIDCLDVDDCATATNCLNPVEICDNTLDDDGDGDIDCADADCVADPACVVTERFLTVIGTSDLHSHLMGVGPARDYTPLDDTDTDGIKSGLARHAAIIKGIKAEKEAAGIPYVLVDSGDALMGDMVDLLSGNAPPVFHFFQLMGYDSVMLGNHDWDWTASGTAVIINAAMTGVGFDRPLLCSNLVTDATSTADDDIETLVTDGVIQRYVLKAIDDDFTVGIFGLMGIEADSNVPQAKPVTFWHEDSENDDFTQIQALVDEIRTAGANLVIHAGHAGINANGIGEDRDVAANVTGIDVIMSGHRHQILQSATKYLKVGSTYIMANGKYGENMTQLDLRYDLDLAEITDATGIVYDVTDEVLGDAEVAGIMDNYVTMLDNGMLIPLLGITYSATPIAHTTFDLPAIDFYLDPLPSGMAVETPAGLMVADAQYNALNSIIYGALQAGLGADPSFDGEFISAALIENGAVRDPIMVGKTGYIAAADAFKLFPLGIGPDGVPGYPMMSFYITPREMKKIMDMNVEVMNGHVPLEYYMNPAGVRYIFDQTRGQFDKTVAIFVCPMQDAFTTMACYQNGTLLDMTDETTDNMLRLTVDYYVALLLPEVRNALGQHMTIEPKLKDGTIIDMTDGVEVAGLRFDAKPGPVDTGIQELKAWVSLVLFVAGLDDDWTADTFIIGTDGNGDPVYLHSDEVTDGAGSLPARIYDNTKVPTVADPFWQLGLSRGMDITQYCAMFTDPRICP